MSIIITVLNFTSGEMLMVGDTRATTKNKITDEVISVNDNYKKIFKITDSVFFGSTGDAREGKILYDKLIQSELKKPSEIIQYAQNITDLAIKDNSTFIISGCYDDGKLFFWHRESNRTPEFIKDDSDLRYFIHTHKLILNDFFEDQIKRSLNILNSIIKTIDFAATHDETICRNYTVLTTSSHH